MLYLSGICTLLAALLFSIDYRKGKPHIISLSMLLLMLGLMFLLIKTGVLKQYEPSPVIFANIYAEHIERIRN